MVDFGDSCDRHFLLSIVEHYRILGGHRVNHSIRQREERCIFFPRFESLLRVGNFRLLAEDRPKFEELRTAADCDGVLVFGR